MDKSTSPARDGSHPPSATESFSSLTGPSSVRRKTCYIGHAHWFRQVSVAAKNTSWTVEKVDSAAPSHPRKARIYRQAGRSSCPNLVEDNLVHDMTCAMVIQQVHTMYTHTSRLICIAWDCIACSTTLRSPTGS